MPRCLGGGGDEAGGDGGVDGDGEGVRRLGVHGWVEFRQSPLPADRFRGFARPRVGAVAISRTRPAAVRPFLARETLHVGGGCRRVRRVYKKEGHWRKSRREQLVKADWYHLDEYPSVRWQWHRGWS